MGSHTRSEPFALSQKVTQLTSEIAAHLDSLKHPELGFSTSSTDVPSTSEYNSLRDSLNDVESDLLLLVNGPKTHARKFLCAHHDLAAYQIAFDYDFFSAVPEDDSIQLSALANKIGLDEDRLGRVLRILCTQRVFQEVKRGRFAHTGGSIIFARDKQLKAAGDYQLDDMFQAAGSTAVSIRKGFEPGNKVKSPFEHRYGVPLFQFYMENPKLAARFASAMAGIANVS